MTSPSLACPFCNAEIDPAGAQGPLECPRCGEPIVWRSEGQDGDAGTAPVSARWHALHGPGVHSSASRERSRVGDQSPAFGWMPLRLAAISVLLAAVGLGLKLGMPSSNTTQRGFPFMLLMSGIVLVASLWLWFLRKPRSNGMLAVFVLANMLCVALAILPYALLTEASRRGNDPRKPEVETPAVPAAQAVAPALLEALGHLPDTFDVVAGIHVRELTENEEGKKLLRPAPGVNRQTPMIIDFALGRMEKATGLPLDEIDHLVLGLQKDAAMIVVRTRKAYDPEALAKAQGRAVPVKYLDRDVYQFQTGPIGGNLLFCADPRTLVLLARFDAIMERDKQVFTTTPRIGAAAAPLALRETISRRLPRDTLIWWAATASERPGLAAALWPLEHKDEESIKALRQARSLAVGMQFDDQVVLIAGVECQDAAAATMLAQRLLNREVAGVVSPKVAGPAPGGSDAWVTLQLRGPAEAVASTLRPMNMLGIFGKR